MVLPANPGERSEVIRRLERSERGQAKGGRDDRRRE